MRVINDGYDLASGVTVHIASPEFVRDVKHVEPIIGECKLDDKGNLILNCDDCGILYTESKILPSHHFRSCALYKRKIHEVGIDYKSRLSNNGFREEQIFSFKMLVHGFKIGVNTGAINWHLQTPSGGERDTMNMTQFNQEQFELTTKLLFEQYGDFISKYNDNLNIKPRARSSLELLKSTNLVSNKKEVGLI
jgi:hypothetical protein